ncbi:MAG: hypothetical protein HKN85_04750, partial [Gammaproteobacteria bacterium]|nr:hypothetical protein [Gammaproteobacteria bacterium]
MRESLLSYLKANQVDDGKYHETMTESWMKIVRHYMQLTDTSAGSDDFIEHQPQLLNTELIFKYYSAELLYSEQARTAFVNADLQAMPEYR